MQFVPQPQQRLIDADDQRQAAMGYVAEAFAEARLDGLTLDSIAHAAIYAAFIELIAAQGEAAAAEFAEGLVERVRMGEFTVERSAH